LAFLPSTTVFVAFAGLVLAAVLVSGIRMISTRR
jgi:hypothetical protein